MDAIITEAVIAAAERLPLDDLPEFIGQLERAKVVAQRRVLAPPPPPTPVEDRLLTIDEAVPLLGLTNFQIAERCRRKEFPAVKIGRWWRIRKSDIPVIMDSLHIEARGARRR